ncbi:MAG: substrate-binding domain-containing protein, partial [Phycisphaerales bacterium]|nr:substrate-binding domain-containing protein [Phycisphaerales bacterium]
MRRIGSVVAACAAAVLAMAPGCGKPGGGASTDTPRVAFVTNGIASFWTLAEAGAKAGAEEFGAEVDVRMPSSGIVDQNRIIEDLLVKGVDGIAISPIDGVN